MGKEVLITSEPAIEAKKSLSRREFLKGATVLGGTLLLDRVVNTFHAQAQILDVPEVQLNQRSMSASEFEPQSQTQINDDQSDEEPSLIDTAKEAVVFTTAKLFTRQTLKSIGVPITPTSDRNKDLVLTKPIQAFAEAVVIGPPIEEALFRFLPSWIISRWTNDTAWGAGVPISLAFAYIHNLQEVEPNKFRFLKDKLPISHFMAGLYFWKVMREKGFSHAATAHGVGNFVAMMTMRIFNKFASDKL